ncbi:MAG: alpha-glucosidase C-terminal domain-containing protein, partial [Anaerolineae bacterium]|nr:alpha-glucosidase C-terminal domain-containing protein [Anaerolineae bacterium]
MIRVRKAEPAFGRGSIEFLQAKPDRPGEDEAKVLAYVRKQAERTILVINNLSADRLRIQLDLADYAGVEPSDLFTGDKLP